MFLTQRAVGWTLVTGGLIVNLAFCTITRDFRSFAGVVALIGLGMIVSRAVRGCVANCMRPVQDAYSEGWESGYDKGWREGRAADRPRLVSLATHEAG